MGLYKMENEIKKIKNYYIVDDDGEVIQELGSDLERLSGGDFIIRNNINQKSLTKIEYKYVKFNLKIGKILFDDCPQAFWLLPYLEYKTNFLMFSNGVYITPTNFAKEIGLSRVRVSAIFSKMKQLDIIRLVKGKNRNVYMFNPYIAMKGNQIYSELLVNFENTKWESLAEKKGKINYV